MKEIFITSKVLDSKSEIGSNLSETIISSEPQGIMNWVLAGMRRLIKQQGFTESKLCQKELEKYKAGKAKNKISLILPEGYQRD